MATDGPLRLGVIGCGMIAQAHAAAFRFLGDEGTLRVVAAADPDAEGLARFAATAGGVEREYRDGHEVIADPEVDAVVLITPTRFHREFVTAVAGAGKPLFTEKPLAPTFDVVRELCAAVAQAGIPAQVGFQSRFHPIVREVKRLVDSGELGAPMGYVMRDDQYWPTGDVVPGHTSWRSERAEAGGGALLEHSIHGCDKLVWLFGPARRVSATTRAVFGYSVEDTAAVMLEHAGGVVGTLVSIFNGVRGREESRLEVFFERGTVELTTDFVVGAPEDSLLVQRPDEPAERVDVDALRRRVFAEDGCDPEREYFVYQYFAHRAFARSLREGRTPSPGFEDALQAHAIVEAGYRSAARGAVVDLDEL